MQKKIFVIFKTHLDIGFTDLSKSVVDKYINVYIPNAIRVGYELLGTDTPFVWTVGSWLVDQALKRDESGMVEKAIRDGIINWHALPFTTHTEIMSPKLFEYGLGISQKLDKRFKRNTIASKMTDVPGHTKGIIPYMCDAGVKFIHIGINPATPMPPVPSLFRWKCGDKSIVVMYQDDYGLLQDFGDFGVCFAHTGDNFGPPPKEAIINTYENLKKKYPEYELVAASLNDLAERVCEEKYLPVLENEIGDLWIHGVGTDPQKVSRYKRLLREIEDKDLSELDLTDNLLLVPEHTWGKNLNVFFHNSTHYTHNEMAALTDERAEIEESWQEQREYVEKAEKLLGVTPEYPIIEPDLNGYSKIEGTLPEIELSWQIFDNSDYERYKKDYLRWTEENSYWSIWDNIKVGLPDYKGGIYNANVKEAYCNENSKIFKLEFDENIADEYGLPYFYVEIKDNKIDIKWFGKKPSRLPQACWLKIKGFKENWEIDKLGQWIKPDNIVGAPLISAFDSGIRNETVFIRSFDATLAAPFGRKLLHYADGTGKQDMYFNLYNNVWNTNFPMWYSDDAMFRFEITYFD